MRARALVEGAATLAVASFGLAVALRQAWPANLASLGVIALATYALVLVGRVERLERELEVAHVWNRRLNEANANLRAASGGSAAVLEVVRRTSASARRAVDDLRVIDGGEA